MICKLDFAITDENYFGGAMRYVKAGNTEIVCNLMKELIPADGFKIEMSVERWLKSNGVI